MFTTPTTSHASEILRNIAHLMNIFAHDAEVCDLSLLDSIATTASQVAQDLRLQEDALLAQIDELEALRADQLIAESDALDHSAR